MQIQIKHRFTGAASFPLSNNAPARVGRLRAYGNAINAIQAQIWCETVMAALSIRAAAAIGDSNE
ncbi:putative methyltransferase protein [Ralstonia phage RpY1]|nr:putative methyltransferase protein [Ralstonia phage RpY1]